MRATAGFDTENAVGGQRIVLEQEIGVFTGIDIVGDHGDIVVVAQCRAELLEQGGFAGADRATHANA